MHKLRHNAVKLSDYLCFYRDMLLFERFVVPPGAVYRRCMDFFDPHDPEDHLQVLALETHMFVAQPLAEGVSGPGAGAYDQDIFHMSSFFLPIASLEKLIQAPAVMRYKG